MADGRLQLCHKPSGMSICIGKHCGLEWYTPIETVGALNLFYRAIFDWAVDNGADFHDGVILLQEGESGWQYTDDFISGFRLISFKTNLDNIYLPEAAK